jgi:hypothetical protein
LGFRCMTFIVYCYKLYFRIIFSSLSYWIKLVV